MDCCMVQYGARDHFCAVFLFYLENIKLHVYFNLFFKPFQLFFLKCMHTSSLHQKTHDQVEDEKAPFEILTGSGQLLPQKAI